AIITAGNKVNNLLQNLITNSIKFSDEGRVSWAARQCTETGMAEFKVADTGTGIEDELLPSIFEMFRQLDSSVSRNHEGAGLGLYIVKKYTDVLGGKIDVESTVGKGSVFTGTLPLVMRDDASSFEAVAVA